MKRRASIVLTELDEAAACASSAEIVASIERGRRARMKTRKKDAEAKRPWEEGAEDAIEIIKERDTEIACLNKDLEGSLAEIGRLRGEHESLNSYYLGSLAKIKARDEIIRDLECRVSELTAASRPAGLASPDRLVTMKPELAGL